MSVRVMTAVWDIALPDSEKIVLLALADCANDEGHCWPSMATLAKKCSKGERTVQGSIKNLVEKGHLTRREVVGKGCNYTVHPRSGCAPAVNAPPQPATQTPAAAADKPSRTINSSEAKASSVKRAKPSNENWHRLPEDWTPAKLLPAELAAKVAQWPPGKIEEELNALRDWAANAKNENGKGRKLNWDTAWHAWLRRADQDWRQRNGSGSRTVQQAPDGRSMGRTESAAREALARLSGSGNSGIGGQTSPALAGGNHGGPLALPDPDSPHRYVAGR